MSRWMMLAGLSLLLLTQCAHPSQETVPKAGPLVEGSPRQAEEAPQPFPEILPVRSWRRVDSAPSLKLPAGVWMHRFAMRDASGKEVSLQLVQFDRRNTQLLVLDQPDATAGARALAPLLRVQGAVAGVNGGFFRPDFTPLGRVVASDGRSSGSFEHSRLISGAVRVRNGVPALVWNREVDRTGMANSRETVVSGEAWLQAGPRLVDAGRPVAGLDRNRSAARVFVATDGGDQWLIGTARELSLAALAELLASPGWLPGLAVQRALNLDGGRSTAFYARAESGEEIVSPGWRTVRNYLAVVPR